MNKRTSTLLFLLPTLCAANMTLAGDAYIGIDYMGVLISDSPAEGAIVVNHRFDQTYVEADDAYTPIFATIDSTGNAVQGGVAVLSLAPGHFMDTHVSSGNLRTSGRVGQPDMSRLEAVIDLFSTGIGVPSATGAVNLAETNARAASDRALTVIAARVGGIIGEN